MRTFPEGETLTFSVRVPLELVTAKTASAVNGVNVPSSLLDPETRPRSLNWSTEGPAPGDITT
jgi:hypothetical protein